MEIRPQVDLEAQMRMRKSDHDRDHDHDHDDDDDDDCKTEMQSLMLSAADTDAFYSHDGVSSRALMSPDVPDTDVSIHDVHRMHVC